MSRSPHQTVAIGRAVATRVGRGDLIALFGPLGVGKTQFVRGLAVGLGIDSHQVASPTFVFMHEYLNPVGGPVLVHLDAYRLTSPADSESIGWEAGGGEFGRDAVIVIEWPDRLGDVIGENHLQIHFEHKGEHTRNLTFSYRGTWIDRSRALEHALANVQGHQSNESGSESHLGSHCPICGAAVTPEDPLFPFCGSRCKTIDLGRWIDGKYFISRPLEQEDQPEG